MPVTWARFFLMVYLFLFLAAHWQSLLGLDPQAWPLEHGSRLAITLVLPYILMNTGGMLPDFPLIVGRDLLGMVVACGFSSLIAYGIGMLLERIVELLFKHGEFA